MVNVHDEFQYEVEQERADEFGRLAVQSIIDAGNKLNLRCKLDENTNWKQLVRNTLVQWLMIKKLQLIYQMVNLHLLRREYE